MGKYTFEVKMRRVERDGRGVMQKKVGRKWVVKCVGCGKYHIGVCGCS